QGISLMRLGKWASGGDCESTSPRSLDELAQLRTHTAHYSPVMIAPLLINSSQRSCRPERSFFSGSRHDCGLCGPQSRRGRAGEELDLAYDRTNSVGRVTPESPAERAGIKRGDVIVGVNGEQAKNLADFYRKVWAQGSAGATVALDVLQDNEVRRIEVKSMNRLEHLKLKSTF